MKNKGFSLIELLAVILILGLIALIAIPVVNNILNDIKYKSFEISMDSVISIIDNMCQIDRINEVSSKKRYVFEDGVVDNRIDSKGTMPKKGVVIVDESCNINAHLSNGTYAIKKSSDNEEIEQISSEQVDKYMIKYDNGTLVYYNPTNGEMCSSADATVGPGTMSGCMRWYIFNDEVGNDTVNMILEHNIYKQKSYDLSLKALEQLEWVDGLNPRMMSLEEFKLITDDNINTFDTEVDEEGYGIYTWLYNYTRNCLGESCTNNKCQYDDFDNSSLYWLSTKTPNYETSTRIYAVSAGAIKGRVKQDGGVGLRPVVTIEKNF